MSHFIVGVIIPKTHENLVKEAVDFLMAPYNEELEVPRYVQATREQLIAKGRKEIEDYKNGIYAKYLKDPEAYKASTTNEGHIKYLQEEFPRHLEWDNEEIYSDQTKYEEKENIGPDGEVYSTANPNGFWDWFRIGGRWDGFITKREKEVKSSDNGFNFGDEHTTLEMNMCRVSEANLDCFAFVTPDGVWHQKAKMGWWAATSDEKDPEAWEKERQQIAKDYSDYLIVGVDAHI